VAVASEALESCGGAGYVEDTGLPRLLRDAQVLPIWEGTTNVLSLDTLRALAADGAFAALEAELERAIAAARDAGLAEPMRTAQSAFTHAAEWLSSHLGVPAALEQGARRFALTAGRALALALLGEHAEWCLRNGRGPRAAAAARRFARQGIDLVGDFDAEDVRLLSQ
jgi:hypothetical protein